MLLASGLSPAAIRTQLASGALVRVRTGVYIAASRWPDNPAARHLVLAHAEQVAHPGAVMSHESAAVSWRLPHPGFGEWHEAPPSVTVVGELARSRRGPAIHHLGALPMSQVTRDDEGYDLTTIARTAVDLAAGLPLPEALVLLDDAARKIVEGMVNDARRRDYSNPRLAGAAREMLAQAAMVRRPAGLSRAVALTEPMRESVAESLTAGHLHVSDLPLPLFQATISTPGGAVYPDFYWPEFNLVGEVDGKVKYLDPAEVVREKRREQLLRDLGYRIVRWLAEEIMLRPHVVLARIAVALGG
jgi:very-short-patch-repair endonuclease